MTISQIGHGQVIESPTPDRRFGGLLDVADVRQGITWIDPNDAFLTWNCLDTNATVVCGPDTTPAKTFKSPTVMDGAAFVAYLGLECRPLGGDLPAQASRVFDLAESRAVERGFESALLASAPAPPSLVTGSTGPVAALATLEQALAGAYVGVGTIHMSPALATVLLAYQLIVERGGRFYTGLGTKVVVGAGYGAKAMYATGDVVLYAGQKVSVEGPNMSNNVMSALAERAYVAFTDCVAFKVTDATIQAEA